MSNKIKLKRGLSSNISSVVLDDGEVALTTDTNKLYSKKEKSHLIMFMLALLNPQTVI